MLMVLKKYGFLPKLIETIRKMYKKFALKFKKGEKTVSIVYPTGVHQGNNLAPILFIIVFQAAIESIGKIEEMRQIHISKYKMFPNTAKGKPQGRLIGQNTQLKDTEFPHWISLYVNNSAFILTTREDTSKSAKLALKHLRTFGLRTTNVYWIRTKEVKDWSTPHPQEIITNRHRRHTLDWNVVDVQRDPVW